MKVLEVVETRRLGIGPLSRLIIKTSFGVMFAFLSFS